MKMLYNLVYLLGYVISLLPLWTLHIISDMLYFFLYHIIGYRKSIVRKNLAGSFPEKNGKELKILEKEFYSFFCDNLMETVKLFSISDKQLRKRMAFIGIPQMVDAMRKEDKQFVFIYLGHCGNWEWISSLTARIHEFAPEVTGGQIYHPLRNKVFDRLLLGLRSRFDGVNIPMKETLRYILKQRKKGERTIIGFIADQIPKWNSIHHWTQFMNRKTPVFTGTEQIGKQVDALFYYAHVDRIRRGYYRCTLTRMVENTDQYKEFEITDKYFKLLEQSIRTHPTIWLWTHNRWKRTYEEYVKRQKQVTDAKANKA